MSGKESKRGRKWARQIDHTVQERVKGTKGIKDRVTVDLLKSRDASVSQIPPRAFDTQTRLTASALFAQQ